MTIIKELDRVKLNFDIPGTSLKAGDSGTVVFIYKSNDLYEIEFIDKNSVQTLSKESIKLI